jgi:hypothetical protein
MGKGLAHMMLIIRRLNLLADFIWLLSLALGLSILFQEHFSLPLGIALALYGFSATLDDISTKIALSKPNVMEINPVAAYIFSRFGLGAKGFALTELSILAVVFVSFLLSPETLGLAERLSKAFTAVACMRLGAGLGNVVAIFQASRPGS